MAFSLVGCASTPPVGSLDPSIQSPVAESWPQFNPLVRMTVGQADQFQLTGDGEDFFFTRSENLAKTILHMRRTVEGGQSFLSQPEPLFDLSFDTQDPAWDTKTRSLAYLSFARSARGEVCVRKDVSGGAGASDQAQVCIRPDSGKIHSPVWGDDGSLYVLVRQLPWGNRSEDHIQRVNLQQRSFETVFRYPQIGSFTLVGGGSSQAGLLAVGWEVPQPPQSGSTQADPRLQRPHFIWLDTQSSGHQAIRFVTQFPGFPVTPQFTRDGNRLLFGQFMDDSNGDGRLDGDDRSAVLSVPAAALWKELKQAGSEKASVRVLQTIPEQLTEARANCLYPHEVGAQLFVTCADGGSLDIYAVRDGSRIPGHWSLEFLYAAREEAATVDQQLLLTNRIRVLEAERSGDSAQKTVRDGQLEAELVLLHAENGDFRAASETLKQRVSRRGSHSAEKGEDHHSGLQLQAVLLQMATVAREYRNERVSLAYRDEVTRIEQQIDDLLRSKENSAVSRAFLRTTQALFKGLAGAPSGADTASLCKEGSAFRSSLRQLDRGLATATVARYLRIVLLEEEKSGRLPPLDAASCLAELALSAAQDERVSSSLWIDALFRARQAPAVTQRTVDGWQRMVEARVSADGQGASAAQHLLDLLNTQHRAQNVAAVSTEEERGKAFRAFADALTVSLAAKETPRVRRRAHMRLASAVFSEADQFLLLALHTSNWLSATALGSFEYGVIIEQYRRVTMARGYGEWINGNTPMASDIFLQSIRLTREEEAHLSYVLSALAAGRESELDSSYAGFDRALGEVWGGRPLLAALRHLVRHRNRVRQAFNAQTTESTLRARAALLESALPELQAAEEALSGQMATRPLVRDLLRGYISHERYLYSLTQQTGGHEPFFAEAYRRYSLALEWARDRGRIRSLIIGLRGSLSLLGGRSAAAVSDFRERRDGLARAEAGASPAPTSFPEQPSQRVSDHLGRAFVINEARALALSGRPGQAAVVLGGELRGWGSAGSVVPPEDGQTPVPDLDQKRLSRSMQSGAVSSDAGQGLRRLEGYFLAEGGRFSDACAAYARVPLAVKSGSGSGSANQIYRVLGSLEHEAWACFRAGESGRASTLFAEIYKRAGHEDGPVPGLLKGSDRWLKRQAIRGDFLDAHADLTQARAAGYLAQLDSSAGARLDWLNRRRVHLSRVIADAPDVGQTPAGFRKQRIKAALEVWLIQSRNAASGAKALRAAHLQGVAGLQGPADEVADDARALRKDGDWTPSQGDFEALRHWGLLLLLGSGVTMQQQMAAEGGRQLYAEIVQALCGSGSDASRGSWGSELLFQAAQVRLIAALLSRGHDTHSDRNPSSLGAHLGEDAQSFSEEDREKLAAWYLRLEERARQKRTGS